MAEEHGFTHAWFYDSPMVVGDAYASIALTGSGEEIITRLKALEAAGLTQVAIQVVNDGKEMIEEFSREVIAKY